MTSTHLDPQLREELSAVAKNSGCELLECEFKGGTLRLTIDRPEGVSLDDCQSVSKQVSALLDLADFGSARYVLEVSSPGLNRKFYAEDDYRRFRGERVRVTWQNDSMTKKRTVVAMLTEYLPERGEIVLFPVPEGEALTIPLESIQLARLEPEF